MAIISTSVAGLLEPKALSNLVELTQTASLRTLIAEHGADIIDLAWHEPLVQKSLFQHRSGPPVLSIWTQCDDPLSRKSCISLVTISVVPHRTTNHLMCSNIVADLCIIVFSFTSKSFYILPLADSGRTILSSFWFLAIS